MSIYEENVQAIVDYFKSGIKEPDETGRLGVELEHTIVGPGNVPVSYSEEHGVKQLLEQLAEDYPNRTFGEDGSLLGVARPGQAITLEPAAQLELSAGPYENVGEIRVEFDEFQRNLAKILDEHGHRALAVGYHPTAKAADLEMIPKKRYEIMDRHFSSIGQFGRCMMRGSASTQVSIDYYSENDCIRKMRLASILSPLFSLICDNSSVFEGATRSHHLVRTEIWQKCDPARCGTVPGLLDANFNWDKYARYILGTPAVMAYDEAGELYATEDTFAEVYADTCMTREQVEHVLSLFFNDVRCKTYVEIRPADAMPIPFVVAYAALIKGLFYSDANMDALDDLLADVNAADVDRTKSDLMEHGYDASVYGKPADEFALQLIEMALAALSKNERSYLGPLTQLARSRKTLAMMGQRL